MVTLSLFAIGATPFRSAGFGLVCAEAKYASVWYAGIAGLERRLASVTIWRTVELEQASGLPTGPVDHESAVVTLLLPPEARGVATVHHVLRRDFDAPGSVTRELLDAELQRHTAVAGHDHHKAERRAASVTMGRLVVSAEPTAR